MKKLLLALLVLGGANAFAMAQYQFTPLQSAVQTLDANEVARLAVTASKSDIENALREADWRLGMINENEPSNADLRLKFNRIKAILNQYK